ncbi:MAG: hypothetical protein WAJ86_18440, partial [Candidatus Acidiferrales bacterium]
VGLRAMDSKVALGLNMAPKIRPIELTFSGSSADGTAVLAMSILQDLGFAGPHSSLHYARHTEKLPSARFG